MEPTELRLCSICGISPVPGKFYRKCDGCFISGQHNERQTGRTCAKLALLALAPTGLYVVPTLHMAHVMRSQYPMFAHQIITFNEVPKRLKSSRGIKVFFDHTVMEMVSSETLVPCMQAILQTAAVTF